MSGFAEQRESGGFAGPRRQRGVAQPAAATSGGRKAGAGPDQIGQQPPGFVQHDGAVGHLHLQIGTRGRRRGLLPIPGLPEGAVMWGWKWKSSRVCTCGSTTKTMLPPRPPLPPSGPPSGLNFSRWTEAQPLPPEPAPHVNDHPIHEPGHRLPTLRM
ncbi:hypothetical protein I545_7001 [Mycobacterium kansasii 662]|uniref:Uncharacterized protein n=1 Tax=Mycobacterium kansasii 662 TaxID=1299326 RepID=X7XQE8_MYCKA|nr:hypothetical protein I545_7001 [Mycobacterium kansasii 662]